MKAVKTKAARMIKIEFFLLFFLSLLIFSISVTYSSNSSVNDLISKARANYGITWPITATFSSIVYDDWQKPSKPLPKGWSYFIPLSTNLQIGGYYAESFIECEVVPGTDVKLCSIVIAHRGVVPALWSNKYEAFLTFFNSTPDYYYNAIAYIDQVRKTAKAQYPDASLMYYQTGHSLGALIAELTTGSTVFDGVNTEVFDSPGALTIIRNMMDAKILPSSALTMTAIWTTYDFSGANLINTTNPQIKPPHGEQIGNYEFNHEDFAQAGLPLDTLGSPGLLYFWSGYTTNQHHIDNFYYRWNKGIKGNESKYGVNLKNSNDVLWPSGWKEAYAYYTGYKLKPRFDYWSGMVDYLWQHNPDLHKTYQDEHDFFMYFIAKLPSGMQQTQTMHDTDLMKDNGVNNANNFNSKKPDFEHNVVPVIPPRHRTWEQVVNDNYAGQADMLKAIYAAASPDERLYYVLACDDVDLAEKLIQEQHANVDYQYGDEKLSLLQVSVMLGFKDMMQLLLKYHADPNLKDKAGNTALHTVAKERYNDAKDYAEILIAAGADPEAKNNAGDTPQMVMFKHYPSGTSDFAAALKKR